MCKLDRFPLLPLPVPAIPVFDHFGEIGALSVKSITYQLTVW